MKNRTLYFGDNLEILRKKIPDESFDLIYLDPPFNSNRSYNVLFKEGLQDSPAQVHAFEDSWHWSHESVENFEYLVSKTNADISNLMQALEKMIGHNDMMAYLTMMAVRLIELHRVLKKTGSLYLHCDPTASHYLKIVLDAIFGKTNFRNEIIWKRSVPHNDAQKFGMQHDIIFYYAKADKYFWNRQFSPLSEDYIKNFYKHKDKEGRIYQLTSITAPGGRGPKYEFLGVTRNWRYTKENMQKLYEQGLIIQTSEGTVPRFKRYLDEQKGVTLQDLWDDILPLQGQSSEYLGYTTQKPEKLLERIINASTKSGDWVLDPFCGCGTTVSVAERLKRNWVGIDVTALAINLIKRRLQDQFGLGAKQINVDGLPTDLTGAKELFKKDPFEFEYWALDLIDAMPAQSKTKENMRGADKGVDGVITFHKKVIDGKIEYGKAIVQVKGGTVHRDDIATLKSDVEREKADAGIFITLENPTKPMLQEIVDMGSFKAPITGDFEFPKIQILTIEELLKGKIPQLPQGLVKPYHREAKAVKDENGNSQKSFII
ncbi:MAG: DNA methyltransferase [bacterium]